MLIMSDGSSIVYYCLKFPAFLLHEPKELESGMSKTRGDHHLS